MNAADQATTRRLIGLGTGLPVLATAGVVLFSWLAGLDRALSVFSGFPTMKFNTAVAFVAIGTVLILSISRRESKWVAGLSLAVLGLASATVVQYIAGVDLRIDQALVNDSFAGPHPGRMSAATAVCMALIGLLWVIPLRGPVYNLLLAAGVGLALLPIAIYVYEPHSLRRVPPFATMAVHTSVGLLLCFLGTSVCAPNAPASKVADKTPGGEFLRRFLAPLAATPLLVGGLAEFGRSRGLYSQTFSLALAATASVLVIIAILFWGAREFDVTSARIEGDRKAAEQAHMELMSVLSISADALLQVDLSGQILYVNGSVSRLAGYSAEELVGNHFDLLIPHAYRGMHDAHFKRFAGGPDGSQINFGNRMVALTKDGDEVPIETTILKHTIGGAPRLTVSLRDRSAAARAEEDLRQEAHTDPLTNVGNRRAFELAAQSAYEQDQDSSDNPSIVVVDIDHFKRVNDEHGHPAGDAVLKQFVNACKAALRTDDYVYRIGGEEFALLLTGADADSAGMLGERLRLRVSETAFKLPGGDHIRVTCSVGFARRSADEDVHDTLARADQALYMAKQAGRNRVETAAHLSITGAE